MPYEQKDNSGSLFKNDKRENDSQPHAKGSAMVDGVEYWVSAWTNTSERTGEKYQKLAFTRKEQPASMVPPKRKAEPEPGDNWSDDIPF
jgi:hypothetical protein